MKTYELDDTDGYTQRFLTVVVAEDIFTCDVVRTVFAWGHPVLKIVTTLGADAPGGEDTTTWWWIDLGLGPEQTQTRHREAMANFLNDTGILIGEDVEDRMETLAGALGNDDEDDAFWTLTECVGEHEPDAFVDKIVYKTPFPE